MISKRKVLYGRILCPYTDEAIRNLFPKQRKDFCSIVSYPDRGAIVWTVTDVTRTTLKLRAYYDGFYSDMVHRINQSVFYVLVPSAYFINS